MSYLSLARKYRPQNFDEIVGQDHIATTLKNAIGMDRVAHAYLFAGPRGVGKTSTARILAKSLNCEKGPTPSPCQKCISCNEISKGTVSMDVIEIDGASNRGIDEIRNLKENIKFSSVHGKFRIYIIDEVHMLTQEAFNALLKTLEEPPAHVKFIFATTKPYKVLPTILSRCQRFDFRRISTQDIINKLGSIKNIEKLPVNDDALLLVAKAADGSLRDAEVILDQLLSFAKDKIKTDDVTNVLGLLKQDILFGIASSIVNNEKEEILGFVNDLINKGSDPAFIASNIIEHFRNLLVVKISKERSLSYSSFSEEDYYKMQEQSQKFSVDEIMYITYTLSATMDLIKKTSLGRIPLEIALIKLTEYGKLSSIKDILDRLTLLEKKLESGPIFTEKTSDTKERKIETRDTPLKQKEPEHVVKEKKDPEIKHEPSVPENEVAVERDILLLQKVKNSWSNVLNFIKNKKMSIATFLSEGRLLKVKKGVLAIGFNKNSTLHKEALEVNTNKKFVEEAIRNVVGEEVFLSVETVEEEIVPEEESATETAETQKIQEPNSNQIDPIVEKALDIFDGRIVDIRRQKGKQ